ncbi:MAG TPA: hypothetical protein VJ764_01120 [Steroidobacteraceae bacterium]|nr:hypothetical protein [Steroidobacteraceae bacterium]
MVFLHGVAASADETGALRHALEETKPIVDLRLRLEDVEQQGLPEEADATTLRGRLGFETGKAWDTALLAEAELVWPLTTDYNDTLNGKSQYPVVADPESYEVNRLSFINTSIPDTTVTLGRQRIIHDEHRFVGNVGWRQNEQTFDALRLVNRSIAHVTLDLTWLNQVNRVFGKDSAVGRYTGNSYLANASYQFALGKLTAFGYLLDFEEAPNDSSATVGARFAGEHAVGRVKLSGLASLATQRDHADNPRDYSDDYYQLELAGTLGEWTAGAGVEVLQGDGTVGFSTPIATLHLYQGWADKFLTTPADGIRDVYATVKFATKSLGALDSLAAIASYHDLGAEHRSTDYGAELDLQLQGKWHRWTGVLKYADYRAAGFATDTRKLWVQLEMSY